MEFNEKEMIERLGNEYMSKIQYCDECFCEYWCIENQVKEGRTPRKHCVYNVLNCLLDKFPYENKKR